MSCSPPRYLLATVSARLLKVDGTSLEGERPREHRTTMRPQCVPGRIGSAPG
jgi:hypothetical protein